VFAQETMDIQYTGNSQSRIPTLSLL